MSSIPALNSGLQGIQKGLKELDRHAADIASARQLNPQTESSADLASALVGLKQSEIQVAISAKIIKAVDETIGTLLDEFA